MLVAKREIYAGRVVRLNVETVDLPNGHRADLEIVHHPGGAAVVAIDAQGRVCLLHQFRHAAGGWIWELPAGKLEPGEPPAVTVRRELVEEGGVRAQHWEELCTSRPGSSRRPTHPRTARSSRFTGCRSSRRWPGCIPVNSPTARPASGC